MINKNILSICIPSHNRVNEIIKNLENLLQIEDNRFDVVITDTSDQKGEYEKLKAIRDTRVKVFHSDKSCSAMENWFCALENADGTFAFHLNDRDRINADKLQEFISFLLEHMNYVGGGM